MIEETLLARTKRLLRHAGLRARKGLGQHFLVDEAVLQLITDTAGLTSRDTVIEVGPGLGILTEELAKRAGRVIAVELDDNLAKLLIKTLALFDNVSIINDDMLQLDPSSLAGGKGYKVVANLPYYITSPILHHFLEAAVKPESMVVMVQKEVAQAIAASPGKMSGLAVIVQYYGKPEIVAVVPAASFFPAPEVDSALLRINLYSHPPITVDDKAGFFRLVRAGFASPRKQFANSLARGLGLPRAEVQPLLSGAKIDPRRRAETLTLEEWAELWKVYRRTKQ